MLKAVAGDKRLKGQLISAIKRVWHRNPVRIAVLKATEVREYGTKKDGTRRAKPYVFYTCAACGALAKQQKSKTHPRINVDHIEPVVPIDRPLDSWDEYIERLFCDMSNLQALCDNCHDTKTQEENHARRQAEKNRKSNS